MTKWAGIPGYSGLYEISDEGAVFRIATHGQSPKPIRRQVRPHRRNKYLAFDLNRDDARQREYAHRLVWIAFVGPIPEGLEINHIDGDRDNNRLENLELVTRSGNMAHCFQHLNPSLNRVKGIAHHKSRLTPEKVIEIRRLRADGVERCEVAVAFGVSRNAIRLIEIGKNWKHLA